MACIGDVLEIKNPLCGIEAEQGEADYGSDLGREVGVLDSDGQTEMERRWSRQLHGEDRARFRKKGA